MVTYTSLRNEGYILWIERYGSNTQVTEVFNSAHLRWFDFFFICLFV